MISPRVNGFHFINSVPISAAEDCFRTLVAALPRRIRCIPDGEPGERQNFARWQLHIFRREPRSISKAFDPKNPTTHSNDEADDIAGSLGDFETGYDNCALQLYAICKKLKDEGAIPGNVRFQVCFPTPVSVVLLCVHSSLRSGVKPLYEEALLRSLERIQDSVPHQELAIQLDCPMEIAMLEETSFYGVTETKPWFEPVGKGILERMAKMAELVAEDVEFGSHLCYGDSGHKRFTEPKSTLTTVNLSNALVERCKRTINYVHMPVPKDRTDKWYFEPFQLFKSHDTELI